MVDLTPEPPPLDVSRAPTPGVSPGQIAQPYAELAENLQKGGQAAESVAETAARQAGFRAVTRAPDGSLQIEKMPILGPASQEYASTMKMAALAEGESAAKTADITLREQFRDNPQGYLAAADAYKTKIINDYTAKGAPEVGLALGKTIDSTTSYTFRGLQNEKENLDLRRADQTISAGMQSAREDAMALARQGVNNDDPALSGALSKFVELQKARLGNPRLSYTQAQADLDLQGFQSELAANRYLYHIDQTYKDKGYQSALSDAQDVLTNTGYKLTDEQRYQFYHKAVGEVRANEAMRRQDIGEARAAFSELNLANASGASIAPDQVESVAGAFRAAGDPAGAARVYAAFARKPLGDGFGQQPLADQAFQVRQLQGGAGMSLATSPAEMRLIQHESGGNPGIVNKLGYAGTYQFGAPLLTDLGLYKPGAGENVADRSAAGQWSGNKWSGTFNIPGFPQVKTLNDFLANPQAQKAAFDIHTANMDKQIDANGLDRYIGQTVGGVPITRDGLHAMIHLGGAEGTLRALQSGGAVNPADANGTSLLDYARVGAGAGAQNPANSAWLLANRQTTLNGELWNGWKTIMSDYKEKGIVPNQKSVNDIIDGARATHNSALLEQVGNDMAHVQVAQSESRQPLAQQHSDITALNAAGEAGQLSPGQHGVLKDLQGRYAAITKGLKDNPIATTVQNFSDRFSMPPPLDFSDPSKLAAGLQQRAEIVQFAANNWQNGQPPALDASDIQAMKAQLANPDPAVKAQIYGAIATLPDAVRGATLAKLGGNDVQGMAQAAAGSMMKGAPDIAQSIFRGMAAIQSGGEGTGQKGEKPTAATKAFDPRVQDEKSFAADVGAALPSTTFSLDQRTSPTGPYATMQMMVRARYADLSAQAGDTKYSSARLEQAVSDVTGGILSHNGQSIIAPARGMSQFQFDNVLNGVTDTDLAGVTNLAGQTVSATYLRGQAKLESYGDGRYLVRIGNNPPGYAYVGANSEAPQKFVLDLRGRTAPSAQFQPPQVAVSP